MAVGVDSSLPRIRQALLKKKTELVEKEKKISSMQCLNTHACVLPRANCTNIIYCKVTVKRVKGRGMSTDQERGSV